jgi:NADH-quinone oxidoreductase chain I
MIKPLLEGLGVTLKHAIRPRVTMQYPDERWEPYPRYRGRHKLLTDEEGRLKCVACLLCATVCPAECITVQGAQNEKGRQYPEIYEIDLGRCIFCGFCVEACPVEALDMTTHFELADASRESLVLGIKELLQEPGA